LSKSYDSPQVNMFLFTCGQSNRTRVQLSLIYFLYSEGWTAKH